jgi:hypothetical protein
MLSVLFVSAWLTMWVSQEKEKASAQATEIENRIKAREAEVEKQKQEEDSRRQKDQNVVLSQQDQIQLAAARQLISKKSFSWNRMMTDIEQYIPPDTRVAGIKVNAIRAGGAGPEADLELKALGKTAAQLTQTMASFQKSERTFEVGEVQQSQLTETGEVPFTVMLQYRPSGGGAQ